MAKQIYTFTIANSEGETVKTLTGRDQAYDFAYNTRNGLSQRAAHASGGFAEPYTIMFEGVQFDYDLFHAYPQTWAEMLKIMDRDGAAEAAWAFDSAMRTADYSADVDAGDKIALSFLGMETVYG